MAILFIVKDKSGRSIRLTQERWQHIQKHPEMPSQLEQIKDTLLHPDTITDVAYDPMFAFITAIIRSGENICSFPLNI